MDKIRIDITIEKDVLERFRKEFVNKKGDLSKVIQEMMINLMKGDNIK